MKKKSKPKKRATRARPRAGSEATLALESFAALVGRSVPTIRSYIRGGMPSLGRRGRVHEIELGPAIRWILEELERRHEEQLASADPRLAEARAKKYEAEAELKTMEAQQRRGELVSREDIVRAGQAFVFGWRTKLRALPRRAVHAGAIEREQERALGDFIDEILTEISAWKSMADAKKGSKR